MSEQVSVGEILKNRREQRGVSLPEAARQIRIRRQYLEALEEERFEEFPGEAYLKGFLRNYAEFLALDPQDIYLRFRQQRPESHPKVSILHRVETELVEPVRPARSGRRLIWVLLLVILAGGIVGYVLATKPTLVPALGKAPPAPESPSAPAAAPAAPVLEPTGTMGGAAQNLPAAVSEPELMQAPVSEESPAPVSAAGGEGSGVATAIMTASGGTVRLQAVDPTELEIAIDDRPEQHYQLQEGAILTWRVRRSARLLIQDPAAVKVWVEDRLLESTNQSELVISTAGAAGNAREEP